MKARDMAAKLMEHPDWDVVTVGEEPYSLADAVVYPRELLREPDITVSMGVDDEVEAPGCWRDARDQQPVPAGTVLRKCWWV